MVNYTKEGLLILSLIIRNNKYTWLTSVEVSCSLLIQLNFHKLMVFELESTTVLATCE